MCASAEALRVDDEHYSLGGFHIRQAHPHSRKRHGRAVPASQGSLLLPCSPHRQHRHRYVILLGPGYSGVATISAACFGVWPNLAQSQFAHQPVAPIRSANADQHQSRRPAHVVLRQTVSPMGRLALQHPRRAAAAETRCGAQHRHRLRVHRQVQRRPRPPARLALGRRHVRQPGGALAANPARGLCRQQAAILTVHGGGANLPSHSICARPLVSQELVQRVAADALPPAACAAARVSGKQRFFRQSTAS